MDRLRILFAGTPEFAAAHLQALLESHHRVLGAITQPDKPGKRGKQPLPSPVKRLAAGHRIPVIQPERLSAEHIRGFQPNVLVVVAYGQLLRRDVLDLPRYGCINVHASLLPRWRGAAPIQRAILAGDTVTGVCTMQMDEGLDTGDILARIEVPIDDDDVAGTLADKLARAGRALLIDTLDSIAEGKLTPVQQGDTGATYANKIDKAEAKIDWELSSRQIERAVRAFNPDPVAYATLEGMRIRIWNARAQDTVNEKTPGEILEIDKQGIDVACGSGILRLLRLQLPIGKGSVLTPADIVNARRPEFRVGNRLT